MGSFGTILGDRALWLKLRTFLWAVRTRQSRYRAGVLRGPLLVTAPISSAPSKGAGTQKGVSRVG